MVAIYDLKESVLMRAGFAWEGLQAALVGETQKVVKYKWSSADGGVPPNQGALRMWRDANTTHLPMQTLSLRLDVSSCLFVCAV